jgi:hypothetical protein
MERTMKAKRDRHPEEPQITLGVDGEPWTLVADFRKSRPTDGHFAIRTDKDGNAEVQFGNGVTGRRPEAGAEITAGRKTTSGGIATYACAGGDISCRSGSRHPASEKPTLSHFSRLLH